MTDRTSKERLPPTIIEMYRASYLRHGIALNPSIVEEAFQEIERQRLKYRQLQHERDAMLEEMIGLRAELTAERAAHRRIMAEARGCELEELNEIIGSPVEPSAGDDRLQIIRDTIQGWLDFNFRDRESSGIETNDDCHVMTPPVWPTRGVLKAWIRALDDARGCAEKTSGE